MRSRATRHRGEAALAVAISACSTIPDQSQLQRLSRSELESALVGNTLTHSLDWGQCAEYHRSDGTGFGRTWGSWGQDEATSEYMVTEDGEICWTYSGKPDWADPDVEYCAIRYRDTEGNYYFENTKHIDPRKIGTILEMEIKPGNPLDLDG